MKNSEDTALLHLRKAGLDFAAAKALSVNASIADEVVGFHIQQSIEKGLKAILAANKVDFRKTHDIRELMDLAQKQSIPIPDQFRYLDEWNPFGVELRYDDIPVGIPPIDRNAAIAITGQFVEWVQLKLSKKQ
jgi:HEPN domain-containing protein